VGGSHSGTLTHTELKSGLARFGVDLSAREFSEVVSKADPSGQGYVNLERFARHYAAADMPAERPRAMSTGRIERADADVRVEVGQQPCSIGTDGTG
jgi:hypothetical protein